MICVILYEKGEEMIIKTSKGYLYSTLDYCGDPDLIDSKVISENEAKSIVWEAVNNPNARLSINN